jgi:hypothetical protein
LISIAQEDLLTFKSGAPIADGGNFSNMKVEALSISEMEEQ